MDPFVMGLTPFCDVSSKSNEGNVEIAENPV